LGARLRAARKARGLTQEALAGPEFTKSYVSAVEREKARPSLRALELLARRLDVPLRDLLPAPPEPVLDLTAVAWEVDLALTEIAILLHQRQAARALQRVGDLATMHRDQLPLLPWPLCYRLHWLRAEAHVRMRQPEAARAAAQAALALAEDEGDPEAGLAARALLGTILLQEGAVRAAQDLLEQCRQTLRSDQVHDPHLALRIYDHLLATYRALDEPERIAPIAQEATDLLLATPPLTQWTHCYLAGAKATEEQDPQRADRYLEQALAGVTLAETLQTAARMQIDQADRLIDDQQYAEAEALLTQAARHIAVAGDWVLPLHLAREQTRLARARGDLDQAQARAEAGIALGEQTLAEHGTADPATRAELRTALACLLQRAGTIAEKRGASQAANAAFARAISVLDPDLSRAAAKIAAAYAELLTARGDHIAAARHYQAAIRYQGCR
jgi:transcriptional regulator with XRE-family HTH domain